MIAPALAESCDSLDGMGYRPSPGPPIGPYLFSKITLAKFLGQQHASTLLAITQKSSQNTLIIYSKLLELG